MKCKKILVVGSSSTGKSTLVKKLMDVFENEMIIICDGPIPDDIDISSIKVSMILTVQCRKTITSELLKNFDVMYYHRPTITNQYNFEYLELKCTINTGLVGGKCQQHASFTCHTNFRDLKCTKHMKELHPNFPEEAKLYLPLIEKIHE